MPAIRIRTLPVLLTGSLLIVGTFATARTAHAQYGAVVPGTGQRVAYDDFEDEKWTYQSNFPKASRSLDRQIRMPLGVSSNSLWYESAKRGQPDVVKRVETPKGGLPGSKGSMLIQTRSSGVPGYQSGKQQQDDLLFNNPNGAHSVAYSPNIIVHVYVPPFEKWEPVTGSTFGFRAGLTATTYEYKRRLFGRRRVAKQELFYPGIFIQFNSKKAGEKEDSAHFVIRRDSQGNDFMGPKVTPGWWTLGMSFTPDGRVHYYARKGAGKLSSKDLIQSSTYGGTRLEYFQTMFFDILSMDNGRSWSTPWIVDNAAIHLGARPEASAQR